MMFLPPEHEQQYPTKLLPHRLQEYVFNDGRPPTTNRAYAQRVTGQQVLAAVLAGQAATGIKDIDPRYFVATCFHEAGCTNEWDTEIATASAPDGFRSVGAYQIGEEEARRFGFTLIDMLDLTKATECMIQLASANLRAIKKYMGQTSHLNMIDYTDSSGRRWPEGGFRAYLAIAHNHGMGFVRTSLAGYGLDWTAYKARNPKDLIVAHSYGEDCVTGGPNWPGASTAPVMSAPPWYRTLKLEHPLLRGEDVKELQRHLNIATDGVFGPDTETAVKRYQKAHGLVADGVVGPKTWTALLET